MQEQPPQTPAAPATSSQKVDKRAQALRANLLRRKQQSQSRTEQTQDPS